MKFSYDPNYFPPAPSIEILLGVPDENLTIGPLLALVDTGADASILPVQYIRPLGLQIDNRKYLRSQWGERRVVDTYLMDVGIGRIRLPLVEMIADERGNEIILGRNLLNKLVMTFNGPKQILAIKG